MDEKAVPYVLLKALKGSAARVPGFTVYDWPFDEQADSFSMWRQRTTGDSASTSKSSHASRMGVRTSKKR